MYSVALIQNQSEMAHYGYADTRPILTDLGYAAQLYTADNIDQLVHALDRHIVDAVVVGSNALNDKTIRATLMDGPTRSTLGTFLADGGGLLSFHQLRLATLRDSHLSFLPSPFSEVAGVVRPQDESASQGDLAIPTSSSRHVGLLYPNPLTTNNLATHAASFRSLPGLYWHYWDHANLADWDVLVEDKDSPANRPLVLATKESSQSRIVLSALTLDWQRQIAALTNFLAFVVEGRHNTAILSDPRVPSSAFEYLIATLGARKFPFKQYFIDTSLDSLATYVQEEVHTNLVLGPGVERSDLPSPPLAEVNSAIADGSLKVLSVEDPEGPFRKFAVTSRERYAIRLLQRAELGIQAELRKGNIDGSFWSTAETLQTLEATPERTGNYGPLVHKALELALEHDRSGSYDEVFGVTCALYWVRGHYLGQDSPLTQRTEQWIREQVDSYEDRERVLAYTTALRLGVATSDQTVALKRTLKDLRWTDLSEIDLITYLRASLSIGETDSIPEIVRELKVRQRHDGSWVDLATSATAAAALLEARDALGNGTRARQAINGNLEGLIFSTVNYIQDSLASSDQADHPYPWDGKASTTVKCLYAWLRFDDLLDLPVYEVVESLRGSDTVAAEFATGRTALAVLEELKEENKALSDDNLRLMRFVERNRRQLQTRRVSLLAAGISLYLLAVALIASTDAERPGIEAIVQSGIIDAWAFHLTLVTAIAAIVVIPWSRLSARLEGELDDKS